MTTTTTPLGERQSIDIRAIERELTTLWKTAADSGQAVTRACVLTLVAVVAGQRDTEAVTATIGRLMARHPNRAIVINATPQASGEQLDAWAQAHCQIPGPNRAQICCEQITIDARGPAVEKVAGTVLPLLVPDVPTVVWWPRGAPFSAPLFEKLGALADRVIVDSATFEQPERDLAGLGGLVSDRRTLGDMAWGRLTPWRELTAQFFDTPATTEHLQEIEGVSLAYERPQGAPPDRTQALLLVGWLASRLGWAAAEGPIGPDDTAFTMRRSDGAAVQITLKPVAPKADALDRLASVEIRCARATFQVSRGDKPNCAVAGAEVQTHAPLRRVVRLEQQDEAQLLSEELRLLGRDTGYESALRVAVGLLERAEG